MTEKKHPFVVINGRKIEPIDASQIRLTHDALPDPVPNPKSERFLKFWLGFRLRKAIRESPHKVTIEEGKQIAKEAVWDISVFTADNEARFFGPETQED